MILGKRPEICNPSYPGCELKLPLLTAEERKRIENMLDYPSEYTSEEFRMALDHVLERCTKAEAFNRGFHDYFLRMKGIWKRWLPIVRKSFVVSK